MHDKMEVSRCKALSFVEKIFLPNLSLPTESLLETLPIFIAVSVTFAIFKMVVIELLTLFPYLFQNVLTVSFRLALNFLACSFLLLKFCAYLW